MGEIMENKRQDKNAPKEENDVRIGMSSIVGKVIGYCNLLLTEKKFRNIKFTAVGGAIGKLVNVVENLKVFHAGLYQSNFLTTVSYQAVVPEEERKAMQNLMDKRREERQNEGERRPRGGQRGGYRGQRGAPRGQRGAPRGQRGGYRGQRGAPRGQRGNNRGYNNQRF